MKEFRLEIDTNTIYIKLIRFVGAFGAGVVIATMLLKYRLGIEFDLFPAISGIPIMLFLAFFPGKWGTKSLHVTKEGIFTYPLNSNSSDVAYWGYIDKIYWEKINSIGLKGSHIYIFPKKGSSKKIHLPLYTKEQWNELKIFLSEAAEVKGVRFSSPGSS